MSDAEAFVGDWERVDSPPCAKAYAARLQFKDSGLYFGQSDPPGEFTWWDAGTWVVESPGKVALSVANDAVIVYGYRMNGDTLQFVDDKGCQFAYRRTSRRPNAS